MAVLQQVSPFHHHNLILYLTCAKQVVLALLSCSRRQPAQQGDGRAAAGGAPNFGTDLVSTVTVILDA
jgi:hypothetical protein